MALISIGNKTLSIAVKSYEPQVKSEIINKELNVPVLISYIRKGKILRKEFSVMYKTPKTPDARMNLDAKNLSNVRQHLFSRNVFLEEAGVDLQVESIHLTSNWQFLYFFSLIRY